MIIADTSGLLALFHEAELAHGAVRQLIESSDEPLVVSPLVVAEIDYLVATRRGVEVELAVLGELSSGRYDLPLFGAPDLARAAEVVAKYRDQEVGATDASLVVLADRYDTKTILTLDRRHFEVLRPLRGGRFKIVP